MAHIRKRIRKLSTAVFRGSRSEYNFDVFPISTAITDHPVVYIFSRRKVDKQGRAHHAVSCVGETQSIVSEIKKHKRAKCVKGNDANVVCILKESDRNARSGVLDDITAVRAFSCVRGKFKPTIKAKRNAVKDAKTAKILPFKPISKAGAASANCTKLVDGERISGKTTRRVTSAPVGKQRRATPKIVKKGPSSDSGQRVSRRVDSDSGQHRLSKPKKALARGTKTRIAGGSRTRAKLAA